MVEEVGLAYVVQEMLPLHTVDSHSFFAKINKIPTTINAVLGITVKNALPVVNIGKTGCHFMLRRRGAVVGCWM